VDHEVRVIPTAVYISDSLWTTSGLSAKPDGPKGSRVAIRAIRGLPQGRCAPGAGTRTCGSPRPRALAIDWIGAPESRERGGDRMTLNGSLRSKAEARGHIEPLVGKECLDEPYCDRALSHRGRYSFD
jgi:hypothetical protein